LTFRASREIGDLVPLLKERLIPEEYGRYSNAIATSVASIQLNLINLLTTDQPGLDAEIEESIATYGSYFGAGTSPPSLRHECSSSKKKALKQMSPWPSMPPEQEGGAWICRFEIGWPGGKVGQWAGGEDSVQALHLAMQMIGTLLYTSDYHKAGKLHWYDDGAGYGFPVANGIRDLLVGHDAAYF
jgi:hypothetical protein